MKKINCMWRASQQEKKGGKCFRIVIQYTQKEYAQKAAALYTSNTYLLLFSSLIFSKRERGSGAPLLLLSPLPYKNLTIVNAELGLEHIHQWSSCCTLGEIYFVIIPVGGLFVMLKICLICWRIWVCQKRRERLLIVNQPRRIATT